MAVRVCIVLEGSYPYITGGVSAWVHDLIVNLPETEFVLFTISPEKEQELRYTLPANVVGHVDVPLTGGRGRSRGKAKGNEILKTIRQMHDRMFTGIQPDIESLFRSLPEGYDLRDESVSNSIGWDMIMQANTRKNPLYPFSDYFWAWRSAHDMIFTVIEASPPEADVYHAVSTGFAGIASLAAKFRRGKPLLLTEHGLYHKEREMEIRKSSFVRGYQRDMWINIYNQFSRICYRHADIVTALFEENRQKQLELGAAKENTLVIPNGIDIESFTVKEREKREGFHVGLVGRVVPIKDIKTFIATAKIVLDRIEEAVFHCIGPTDEDPAYYEDCAGLVESLKIGGRFIFTGRQNVRDYYKFLDVLMLTSVREAQPLVILEAYAAGVPVVATRVGNIAEMLDYDTRFVAPSKDAEALAAGVQYIHDHPDEMKTIIEKNCRKVENFYDKYDLHKKYRELYETLTGKKD